MTSSFFLNHVKPYDDETLASWMGRLIQRNYLHPSSILTRHLRTQIPEARHIALSSLNSTLERRVLAELANLSMTSVETVHWHTIHRFAKVLSSPGWDSESIQPEPDTGLPWLLKRPTRDFYTPNLSWCPQCLREGLYVRWHWHIPLIVICPKHHCWLVETCPHCHALMSSEDVLYGHCENCGFRLSQMESTLIPDDNLLWQFQTTVMNWLYDAPVPTKMGLPDVPVNALLYTLQGLRYSAQRAGNDWHFHHVPAGLSIPNLDILERRSLTLPERASLYTTAFRGLLDWPHGFHDFLDAYRRRIHKMEDKGLRREFGSLYMSWLMQLWRYPVYDFVSEGFNDYLIAHLPASQIVNSKWVTYHPEILERFDYINTPYVAQLLGLPERRILRLIQEGALTPHNFGSYERMLFSRLEVEQMRQRWERHLTRSQAADYLGVTTEIIRDMLQAQVLQPVPASEGIKWHFIYISQDNIAALLHSLQQHVMVEEPPADAMYIAEVCKQCSCAVSMNIAQMLQRICEGKLLAYHSDASLLPLGELWLCREDALALPQLLKQERGLLSLTETLQYIDVKRNTLRHFIDAGLLSPLISSSQKQFFSWQEVSQLKKRMISSREATELLQLPLDTIRVLAKHRILSPISGPGINKHTHYFFDRYELLEWREKYVLFSQLKAVYADQPDLLSKVRQQLKSIFTHVRVYNRKEVMAVLAD